MELIEKEVIVAVNWQQDTELHLVFLTGQEATSNEINQEVIAENKQIRKFLEYCGIRFRKEELRKYP